MHEHRADLVTVATETVSVALLAGHRDSDG
jgi:hypothetical protein